MFQVLLLLGCVNALTCARLTSPIAATHDICQAANRVHAVSFHCPQVPISTKTLPRTGQPLLASSSACLSGIQHADCDYHAGKGG